MSNCARLTIEELPTVKDCELRIEQFCYLIWISFAHFSFSVAYFWVFNLAPISQFQIWHCCLFLSHEKHKLLSFWAILRRIWLENGIFKLIFTIKGWRTLQINFRPISGWSLNPILREGGGAYMPPLPHIGNFLRTYLSEEAPSILKI